MQRLAARDLWAGLFCIAIGAIALVLLANTRMGAVAAMGPGFLPTWLARLLVGLGVLIALKSMLGSIPSLTLDWRVLRPLLLILGAIVLFALLLRPAGFALTAFALLLLAAAAGRDFRWREALVIAAAIATAASLLFIVALKINVPLWPSWFLP
ncbi:MAG: tripartite tricarboxylate transporter TctB family protein [Alphaproteobacteria bacterium]|jgi:hypothetical protein|nr:tripartite tricarboxylate transporter TctB family protein [Alphaproteobacteria bacterium]